MIFQATWQAVLDGTKTETRRICKPGEWLSESKLGAPTAVYVGSLPHEHLKWQVGRSYAVQQARGQKAIGRIRLLEIRQERLQDITEAGAIAEGCSCIVCGSSGLAPDKSGLHMEPCCACGNGGTVQDYQQLWDSIHTKRGERWDDTPLVWVLRFELVEKTE
jgi:hypothetical protein